MPTNTDTRAYVANEVASVYMSFDRNDLVFGDSTVSSLSPGFIGMSDPMNLRAILERFEYSFNYGPNTHMYKIRLINPTTELEELLIRYFTSMYPDNSEIVRNWSEYYKREENLNSPVVSTPEYANDPRYQVPTIYIRWGYGTDDTAGLSQIHKTRISDVQYFMNANEDKVVELMLVDVFTFTKTSMTFNNRQHKAVVQWKDDDNPKGKDAGVMLQELLAKYTAIYPEILVLSDFYTSQTGDDTETFGEKLDAIAAGVTDSISKSAQQKAEKNYLQYYRALESLEKSYTTTTVAENVDIRYGSTQTITEVTENFTTPDREASVKDWLDFLDDLSPEATELIESRLNAPVDAILDFKREAIGQRTDSTILQGLKEFFESINLKWSFEPTEIKELFLSGIISPEQAALAPAPVIGGDPLDQAYDRILDAEDSAFDQSPEGSLIQIVSKDPPNQLNSQESLDERRLGFWPYVLAPPVETTITEEPIAGIVDIDFNGTFSGIDTYTSSPPTTGYELSGKVVITASESFLNMGPRLISYYGTDAQWGEPDFQPAATTVLPIKFLGVRTRDRGGDNSLNDQVFYAYNPWPGENGADKCLLLRRYPIHYPVPEGDIVTAESLGLTTTDVYSPRTGDIFNETAEESEYNENAPREIRLATPEEKAQMEAAGMAPLYLNPGPIPESNIKRFKTLKNGQDYPDGVYDWTTRELLGEYNRPTLESAQATGDNLPVKSVIALTAAQCDPYDPGKQSFPPLSYVPAREKTPNDDSALGSDPFDPDFGAGYSAETFYFGLRYPIFDTQTNRFVQPVVVDGETGEEFPNPEIPQTSEFYTWGTTASGSLYLTEPIFLEPTLETYEYMVLLAEKQAIAIQEELGLVEYEETAPPEITEVEGPTRTTGLPKNVRNQAFLTIGTDGRQPDISQTLHNVVDSLNRLVVNSSSKLEIIQINTSTLTKSQKQLLIFSDESPLPKSMTQQQRQDVIDSHKVIVALGTTDFVSAFTSGMVNRVKSFPKTNWYSTENNRILNNVLVLDYAAKDSIVTDLNFTGEFRWLQGLSQAAFMERMYGSINDAYSKEFAQTQFLIISISRLLDERIQRNLQILANNFDEPTQAAAQAQYDQDRKLLGRISEKGYVRAEYQAFEVMEADILALLPGLVSTFTASELNEMFGPPEIDKLLVLAELCADPKLLSYVFPEADIYDNQSTTFLGHGDRTETYTTLINPRKVDFTTVYQRLGVQDGLAPLKKLADAKFFFAQAMLDEAWEVEVETLGIPELDNGVVEVSERIVALWVYDPRLSTDVPHWLSGVYRIKGLTHSIDPSRGYLTKLSLYRDMQSYTMNPINKNLTAEEVE